MLFSRIGNSSVVIDKVYKVSVKGSTLEIVYKDMTYNYPFAKGLTCELVEDESSLKFVPNYEFIRNKADIRQLKKIVGFHVRDLQNLLKGLLIPFKSIINVVGTGYKVVHNKQSNFLVFSLGFSHDIIVSIPCGVIVEVTQNKMVLSSSSKLILGGFCSYLCKSLRSFDKFKGKGVILEGQYLQRKELKKK